MNELIHRRQRRELESRLKELAAKKQLLELQDRLLSEQVQRHFATASPPPSSTATIPHYLPGGNDFLGRGGGGGDSGLQLSRGATTEGGSEIADSVKRYQERLMDMNSGAMGDPARRQGSVLVARRQLQLRAQRLLEQEGEGEEEEGRHHGAAFSLYDRGIRGSMSLDNTSLSRHDEYAEDPARYNSLRYQEGRGESKSDYSDSTSLARLGWRRTELSDDYDLPSNDYQLGGESTHGGGGWSNVTLPPHRLSVIPEKGETPLLRLGFTLDRYVSSSEERSGASGLHADSQSTSSHSSQASDRGGHYHPLTTANGRLRNGQIYLFIYIYIVRRGGLVVSTLGYGS